MFALVTPASGYKVTSNIIDIKTSSGIQTIKTSVVALAEYAEVNLANVYIYLNQIDNKYCVDEQVTGAKIVYDLDEAHKNLSVKELAALLNDAATNIETVKTSFRDF